MNPASIRLAVAWAAVAPAPLVLAGLLGRERTWGIEAACGGILILCAGLLPWLWAANAPPHAPDDETTWQERLGARASELLLLAAATLPALVLAASFADVTPANCARAGVYVLVLWCGLAVSLSWRAARGRATRIAVVLTWTCVLPFGLVVWRDVAQRDPSSTAHVDWIAPPLALQRLLGGDPLTGPLLVLLGLFLVAGLTHRDLVLSQLLRRSPRPARPALPAAALLALAVGGVGGVVQGDPGAGDPRVTPLLGPYVRAGAPYPLRLAPPLAGGELAARSFGHHAVATAGATGLIAVPLGGGHHVELLRRDGPDQPWRAVAAALPEPRLLRDRDLLVATLGEAGPLAAALLGDRRAARVPVSPADLPLLARAGQAIDVVVVGRGAGRGAAAPALRAWTAAGGVLVCATRTDLLAVVAPTAHPDLTRATTATGQIDLRPLGAGLAAGPRAEGAAMIRPGLADAVDRWLDQRTQRRLQGNALRDAATLAPIPLPSQRSERLAALAALAATMALVLLALGLAPHTHPGTFLGGAALVAVVLALLLRLVAAPSAPVYGVSTQILHLTNGGRVAGRRQFLSLTSARALTTTVTLRGYAPPTPVFDSGLQAVQARAELIATNHAPQVRLPLTPRPRTFQRLDALLLEGAVVASLRADRLELKNHTELTLERLTLVTPRELIDLPDLPAGGALSVDPSAQTPTPLAQWRMAADDPDEAYRRRLVAAAVMNRRSPVVVGWSAPSPTIATGVAEERALPALVVVVLAAPRP